MKIPLISPTCLKPVKDALLNKILRHYGAYYRPPDLFYQQLWKQRLMDIGLRVLAVERLPYHPVWYLRLRGTLAAQAYLLISKPVSARVARADDPLCKQLASEIHQIAKDLGSPIRRDCLGVLRIGTYFRVSFIWPLGNPGCLLNQAKKPEAFSFFIRRWLRRLRN